ERGTEGELSSPEGGVGCSAFRLPRSALDCPHDRSRSQVSPKEVLRSPRPGSRGRRAARGRGGRSRGSRIPVRGASGGGEDHGGAHPGDGAELRAAGGGRGGGRAVRSVRLVHAHLGRRRQPGGGG